MKPTLRIVADGMAGQNAHVSLLDEDGAQTDLRGVTKAVVTLEVGAANRATLELIAINAETDAQLEDIVVRVLPPERAREVVRRLAEQCGLTLVEP